MTLKILCSHIIFEVLYIDVDLVKHGLLSLFSEIPGYRNDRCYYDHCKLVALIRDIQMVTWFAKSRLQHDYRLQVTGCELQVTGCRLLITECRLVLLTTGHRL